MNKGIVKAVKGISGLIAVCLLLILGCNPSGASYEQEASVSIPPGMGSFSLCIEGQNGRTIMPEVIPDFAVYELAFTGTMAVTIDRSAADLSAPVFLLTGNYHLLVTAYIDEGKTQPAAWGG